jgi:hypothetical protein
MAQIITPQDFAMSGRAPVPAPLELRRAPHPDTCFCGAKTLLLLPQFAGALIWRCTKCHRDRRLDFQQARTDIPEGMGAVNLARKPLWHTCQTCGEDDIIGLPLGAGEIRWKCKCGSTWLIKFDANSGRLAKIVGGEVGP